MNSRIQSRISAGFTLIELMIVVVIVAILASIALPSYQSYIIRTKLVEGQAALGEARIKMEQYYQDNRNYAITQCGGAGTLALPTSKYFAITCAAANNQVFTLTATSNAGQGIGAAGDYTYTVNQQASKTTTEFKGATVSKNCWLYRGDEC